MRIVSTGVASRLPPGSDLGCGLQEFCRAAGACARQPAGQLLCSRQRLLRGEALFQAGERLAAVYPISSGSFKADVVNDQGRVQVMGFYLRGEIAGLDGIASGYYGSRLIALEDGEVCAVSFAAVERACRSNAALQRRFLRAMAQEIAMQQNMMLVLGRMSAEERVVYFLLNLLARSPSPDSPVAALHLSMSRDEVGCYVGTTLETVSRVLSNLQQRGLLRVRGRNVTLCDVGALRRLIGQGRTQEL